MKPSQSGKSYDWTKIAKGMGQFPVSPQADKERIIRSLMPTGPEVFGLGLEPINEGEGPGPAPAGFVGGTTSESEWMLYWAYTKLIGPEGIDWTYQQSFQGGRHIPGGSVVDYVLYMPMQDILIRLQTWGYHQREGSDKISRDKEQKIGLFGLFGEEIVVDVYEHYFVNDPSGKAVLACAKDSMAGIEWPDPLATGLAGDW